MKTRVLITIVVLIISTTIFNSCKKYDEGPSLSLRSKKARVEGDWTVSSATYNGADIFATSFYSGVYYSVPCGFNISYTEEDQVTKFTYKMTKTGSFEYAMTFRIVTLDYNATDANCWDTYTTQNLTLSGAGTWKFSGNKEQLILNYTSNNQGNPTNALFGASNTETWDIKELRNTEMKLQATIDNEAYKLTLTQ